MDANKDLVRSQFESNAYPDYEAVLKRAGITVDAMEVEFDAAAPWATQRDALMQPGH